VPAMMVVVFAVVLGLVAGGSFYGLSRIHLRFEWLVLTLFVFQGFARGRLSGGGATDWALAGWLLSSLILTGVLAVNWRIPGMSVAILGTLLNVLVVGVNLGMPFATEPVAFASPDASSLISWGGFYRSVDAGTLLPWLGDVIPVHLWDFALVLSLGDLALAVGVIAVVADGMTSTHRANRQADRKSVGCSEVA